MKPADRYHALDCLRGFAMFLGVVLHAGISFMTNPPPFWSVRDNDPSPLTDVFLFAVHDFRMQLFFLLAGFFGCLLYLKYGALGTAVHRVKRVAIPFALAMVFIMPTVMVAFLYAELDNVRTQDAPEKPTLGRAVAVKLIAENPEKSNVVILFDRFTSGEVPALLAHLWFLYYLLYLYAAALLLAPLVARLSGTRFLARLDAAFRRLIEGRARVLVPALCTLPVSLLMRTPFADTPLWWMPEWHILLYYFGFFTFGWMLYRHRDLITSFGRGWKLNLAVANLVVLPVALGLTLGGIEASGWPKMPIPLAWQLGMFAAQAIYTWLMIVALWGAFLHYFASESATVRYLADASYWCYLASLTPTVVFQFVVKDWPLPGLVKWLLVTVATLAVLLASYEWCVRYTFIGAILNGRKRRTPREEISHKKAVVSDLACTH